jgi:IS5 family transposase
MSKEGKEMGKQQSFTDIEYANRKRRTRRDEFLEMMEELIPWEEWVAVVTPYYYSGKRGRPPRGIEIMLRMYLLANWFNLSDEGVEDAIYDSYSFRKFMGVDFSSEEQVPDATTLCKFRKILDDNGVTKLLFNTVKDFLDKHGKLMHGGSIVDATIIDAPSSTKNEKKERDPEMHQTKKGNQWYFGAKLHIGTDAGTGYIHSLDMTAANVADITMAAGLLREDDEVMYGDSAYSGMEKRDEIKNDAHLASIDYRANSKKPYRKNAWKPGPGTWWFAALEYAKSRVRSKVEYPFLVIKRIFSYRKVRYKGIKKNKTHAYMLCACANLYMLGRSGWQRAFS